MTAAFDRLSPAMQYQIVNGLGFCGLRSVQERTIEAVLDGDNCVVLAPTAGGKTEAAIFPLLSQMDEGDWRPVSVIYVTPLRALLNNQEPRLARYAELIGRRVFKWHGDVGPGARRRFMAEPADVLLTTPESLEVMLTSAGVPTRRLLGGLQAVVVDEIHAFVGDDRGGHLALLLERLGRLCGRDVQRIGLSATVGNPEEILAWLGGSSRRAGRVVRVPGGGAAPELGVDYVGSLENAARVVGGLHRGEKRLVFVDSRRGVEAVGQALRGAGVDAYVTHSSLAASERGRAEAAFSEGRDCVIVATSALELGIDIGDLDRVVQVDCPWTVAGFQQRLGRTGRRAGTRANCLFLETRDDALLRTLALLRLYRAGYVEALAPRRRAAHLFAHQVMALGLQEGGIGAGDVWGWIGAAAPMQWLTEEDRRAVLGHMLAEGILAEDGGRLSLGPAGERRYGRRGFMELYAVFSTPQVFRVVWGSEEIGTVEARFLEEAEGEALTFTLGATAWRVVFVDWSRGVVQVAPAEAGRHARWRGQPVLVAEALCRAMGEVLLGDDEDGTLTRRARERLVGMRQEHAFLRDGERLVVHGEGFRLWNFAGGRANLLLARVLEELLGERVSASNLYLGFAGKAGESVVGIRQAVAQLRAAGRPDGEDALRYAQGCARGRLSKFQPCLPEALEMSYLAAALMDDASARRGLE